MSDAAKTRERWYSGRLQGDITVVRWGTFGRPVLIFPTAGGDAEEVERNGLVDSCDHLLIGGRVKLYSVDSVAGQAMVAKSGSPEYRMRLLSQFHECIRREVVPAIDADLGGQTLDVIAGGASIGAYNALAVLCRYPDVFSAAIGMSGTYRIERFYDEAWSQDLYYSAPLQFLPGPGRDAAGPAPAAARRARGRGGSLGGHRGDLADGVRARREGDTQPGRQLGPAVAARVAYMAPDAAAVPRRAHLTPRTGISRISTHHAE